MYCNIRKKSNNHTLTSSENYGADILIFYVMTHSIKFKFARRKINYFCENTDRRSVVCGEAESGKGFILEMEMLHP